MFNQLPFESIAGCGGKLVQSIIGIIILMGLVGLIAVVSCSAIVGFNIGSASESTGVTPTPTAIAATPTPRRTVAISTYTPRPKTTPTASPVVQPGSVFRLEGIGANTGFLDIEPGIYTVRFTVVGNDRRFAPDTLEFMIGSEPTEFMLKGRDDAATKRGRYTAHASGERAWLVNVGDDARWTVTFEPVKSS